MLNSSDGLKLVLCPTRNPEEKFLQIYNNIYNCWYKVWTAAYSEANCPLEHEKLKSDTFTRHDFAAAVFHQDECIAFILFRYLDMSLATSLEDSFFSHWEETSMNSVKNLGRHIMVCGNLGVTPSIRIKTLRNALQGASLKDVMGGVISEVTIHSKASATLATPRRDKKVHTAAYNWGAYAITEDVAWGFGIQVDLAAFEKGELLQKRDHKLKPLIDNLWLNKLVVKKESFESIQNFENKVLSTCLNITETTRDIG